MIETINDSDWDPSDDYCADWLDKHDSASHPTMDKVMESFRERAGIHSDE